jgi:hypothetical protein
MVPPIDHPYLGILHNYRSGTGVSFGMSHVETAANVKKTNCSNGRETCKRDSWYLPVIDFSRRETLFDVRKLSHYDFSVSSIVFVWHFNSLPSELS